jgi:thymidine phosphorylase
MDEIGCAIVSADRNMAPSDRRLYAIRDVTGTVPSIDLITASILSKKLAAGLDALILDVKCGSGAFMETEEDARKLAKSLVSTATGAGCKSAALITDMSQPLAPAAGNALEVVEVMQALTNPKNSRLVDLSLALAAEVMVLGGYDTAPEVAAVKLRDTLTSGAALAKFDALVAALGGPKKFSEDWRARLPEANVIREIAAPKTGRIAALDGHAIGMGVVHMGGGRLTETDRIDPSVGYSDILAIGTEVAKGAPVARLHAASEKAAQAAERAYLSALTIADDARPVPLMIDRVG